MRITFFELSHLILRFEQEKDMKPMHCVQNLGALRDLVDARVEILELVQTLAALEREISSRFAKGEAGLRDMSEPLRAIVLRAREVLVRIDHPRQRRLISAAPELLEACRRIVAEDAQGEISIGAIEDCGSAIRKAEGE